MEGDKRNGYDERNHVYFNPLPPHGGRPRKIIAPVDNIEISIHSLRMEGDNAPSLTTQPGGKISIHSLRMEGD